MTQFHLCIQASTIVLKTSILDKPVKLSSLMILWREDNLIFTRLFSQALSKLESLGYILTVKLFNPNILETIKVYFFHLFNFLDTCKDSDPGKNPDSTGTCLPHCPYGSDFCECDNNDMFDLTACKCEAGTILSPSSAFCTRNCDPETLRCRVNSDGDLCGTDTVDKSTCYCEKNYFISAGNTQAECTRELSSATSQKKDPEYLHSVLSFPKS